MASAASTTEYASSTVSTSTFKTPVMELMELLLPLTVAFQRVGGPAHAPVFRCTLTVGGKGSKTSTFDAIGRSKKAAKQAAATVALAALRSPMRALGASTAGAPPARAASMGAKSLPKKGDLLLGTFVLQPDLEKDEALQTAWAAWQASYTPPKVTDADIGAVPASSVLYIELARRVFRRARLITHNLGWKADTVLPLLTPTIAVDFEWHPRTHAAGCAQVATTDGRVFILRLLSFADKELLRVLCAPVITRIVGTDLGSDRKTHRALAYLLDEASKTATIQHARPAVAYLKNKQLQVSNWSAEKYTVDQVVYAAADVYLLLPEPKTRPPRT